MSLCGRGSRFDRARSNGTRISSLPLAKFGEQLFDDIDRGEFFASLSTLQVSAGTRAGIVRACRALWRWGMAQQPQLVARDITAGLAGTGPTNGGEAEFLSVDEVAEVLNHAGPYRLALAMLFFAGIRPEELAGRHKQRLRWRHVRTEEKLIRVPAEIAKTGKPRLLRLA
jgi:hypothetical protein